MISLLRIDVTFAPDSEDNPTFWSASSRADFLVVGMARAGAQAFAPAVGWGRVRARVGPVLVCAAHQVLGGCRADLSPSLTLTLT
jgi:hypothetical protein